MQQNGYLNKISMKIFLRIHICIFSLDFEKVKYKNALILNN